jgi:hypothetical protein
LNICNAMINLLILHTSSAKNTWSSSRTTLLKPSDWVSYICLVFSDLHGCCSQLVQ